VRIAVIGSGNRVRAHFLPAFACLDGRIEVTGIWSRTHAHAREVADAWGFRAPESLAGLLDAHPDVIALSVSADAVPGLLAALARRAPDAMLLLDTPVLGRGRDLHAIRLLRRFRRVLVAEDYMNYPHFELMRDVAANGAIGRVREVAMHGNGYRYHGLATIRSFFGFRLATSMRTARPEPGSVSLSLRFDADRRGRIEEPYAPQHGHTTVTGATGTITDGPAADGALVLRPVFADREVVGFRLAGHEISPPGLETIRRVSPPGGTLFAELKTCGLVRVLESLWSHNLNTSYTYRQALYDHLTTAIGRHLPTGGAPGTAPRSRAVAPIGR
jgi:hypothetical protein